MDTSLLAIVNTSPIVRCFILLLSYVVHKRTLFYESSQEDCLGIIPAFSFPDLEKSAAERCLMLASNSERRVVLYMIDNYFIPLQLHVICNDYSLVYTQTIEVLTSRICKLFMAYRNNLSEYSTGDNILLGSVDKICFKLQEYYRLMYSCNPQSTEFENEENYWPVIDNCLDNYIAIPGIRRIIQNMSDSPEREIKKKSPLKMIETSNEKFKSSVVVSDRYINKTHVDKNSLTNEGSSWVLPAATILCPNKAGTVEILVEAEVQLATVTFSNDHKMSYFDQKCYVRMA